MRQYLFAGLGAVFETILLILVFLFWALTAEAGAPVGAIVVIDYGGHCADPLVEYYSAETDELLQLDQLSGDWSVVDVEEFIDMTTTGEPTKYKLFVEPVPDKTVGEPAMFWYGGEGPYYDEEVDNLFAEHQLP